MIDVPTLRVARPTDNLLDFISPDRAECEAGVQSMRDAGFQAVASFNPFWAGTETINIEDPDDYGSVLNNSAWAR